VWAVWRAVADWWDSVELWVTQLAFPFQVLLALVVVLPVCWFAAAAVDRLVGLGLAAVARSRQGARSRH
jgi:hypothetical protein